MDPRKHLNYYLKKQYQENVYPEIIEFISKCTEYAKEKTVNTQTCNRLILPKFAFHTVSIDIVDPFPTSTMGKNICLQQLTS